MDLDRIRLDDLRVKTPSGREITPHAGQSVWVYPYGRSLDDVASLNQAVAGLAGPEGDAALTRLCEFLASEIGRHDVENFRTGEPYPTEVNAANIRQWPDDLVAFLVRRMTGQETEGEGSGGSAASPEPSTETAPSHAS